MNSLHVNSKLLALRWLNDDFANEGKLVRNLGGDIIVEPTKSKSGMVFIYRCVNVEKPFVHQLLGLRKRNGR